MNMISTGAFQTEMDSSIKENTTLKKLVSLWEKKNSKTARAGGVSLMALSLAACGGEDTTPFSQADVDSAKTAASTAATTAALTGSDGTVHATVDAAVTSNDATVTAAATTAALTATDGTIYTDVNAAVTAGSNLSNSDAVTAALTGSDGTVHASVDAAVTSNDAAVTTAATTAAEATLMAGVAGFDTIAALSAAYNNAIAAAPATSAALTTSPDSVMGTVGNDAVTGSGTTYTTGDVIIDSNTSDADTLTITSLDDVSATPTVSGFETVTFNLDASTTSGTATSYEVDVANITNGNIVLDVVKAATTVTSVSVTNVAAGATVSSDLSTFLLVNAQNDADITISALSTGTTTITDVTAVSMDDLTINAAGALVLTDAEADEDIIINGEGAVTITDINPDNVATTNTLTVNAKGTVTITATQHGGALDVTTTTGNIVVTDADAHTGAGNLTASNGNVTVTSSDASTGTLTISATGDGDANAAAADGDITVTSADGYTTANLTASGGISVTQMDAVTSMTLTAGQASDLQDVAGVTALTLASTGSTATRFTAETGQNALNAVDTITFTGSGDTTLRLDATDIVVAAASTAGGTTAAAVIATDSSSGNSRIEIMEAITSQTIDLSALAVDEIALGATSTITGSLTLASGANLVIAADQTALILTAAAVAGNTATVTIEDNSTAVDTDAHDLTSLTTTNIANLTLQVDDTERVAGVKATTVNVGTANTLTLSGAGNLLVGTSITAKDVVSNGYTGKADIKLVNSIGTDFTTGSGDDTFRGDGTGFAAKLDGGAGVDTLITGTTEDYSGVALSLSNIEKVDASSSGTVFAANQVSGQTILFFGDGAADTVAINATVGTGETIDMSNSDVAVIAVTVTGSNGADTITGSATGAMTLAGGSGIDIIAGGAAADFLNGGAGADTLTGGGGVDTFEYQTVDTSTAAAMDTIKDFTTGATGDLLNFDTTGDDNTTNDAAVAGNVANQIASGMATGTLATAIAADTTIAAAITEFLAASSFANNDVGGFVFGGDTYVVHADAANAAGNIVKLEGVVATSIAESGTTDSYIIT